MPKGRIIQEVDQNLIRLTPNELMEKFRSAKINKRSKEAEELEKEMKRRDLQTVNESLHRKGVA